MRSRWVNPAVHRRTGASPRRGRNQKHKTKRADLDFVVVGQHSRVHWLAVDVGAIEAAGIGDMEFAALTADLGVAAADGDVVEKDVTVGMAACRRDVAVQQEAGPSIRPALDDQQRRAAW